AIRRQNRPEERSDRNRDRQPGPERGPLHAAPWENKVGAACRAAPPPANFRGRTAMVPPGRRDLPTCRLKLIVFGLKIIEKPGQVGPHDAPASRGQAATDTARGDKT